MTQQLTGKSIQELTQAPALFDNTNLIVQREGSSRAEKTQLASITEHVTKSPVLKEAVQLNVNTAVKSAVTLHTTATDPHGDRAYANSLLSSHIINADPHGSKLYTDQKISTHAGATDPHGDRNYSDTRLAQHSIAIDPHGDRTFTSQEIGKHSSAIDPHGDRLHSETLMLNHEQSTIDPHGDRSYSDTKLIEHKNEENPHGLKTFIQELFAQHESNIEAHSIDQKLLGVDETIRKNVEQNISQKLGTVIPTLEFGKIPNEFISDTVVIDSYAAFPTIGDENILYVDRINKSAYIWSGSNYVVIASSNGGTDSLSTDDVAEGVNPDRRYFTQGLETALNSKVANINNLGEGNKLVNEAVIDGKVYVKSLKSKGVVSITDEGDSLSFSTNDYVFVAKHDGNVKLSSDTNLLENITNTDVVNVSGYITATQFTNAGGAKLVSKINRWTLDLVLKSSGTSEAIVSPASLVISSNGLVITGQAPATHDVEIYTASNSLIGKAVSLTEGSFTVALNDKQLRGTLLKAYTVTPEGNRSEPTYFYSKNTESIKPVNALTVSPLGTHIRGNTSHGANITVKNLNNDTIAEGVADIHGNFNLTLNAPVISGDTLSIISQLDTTLTDVVNDYIVALKNIDAPHNIELNLDRTVLTGKAEPNSILDFRFNEREYKTTSNASGEFTFYSFMYPINVGGDLIIGVSQEERRDSIGIVLDDAINKTEEDPLVSDKLLSITTDFLIKNKSGSVYNDNTSDIDMVYNSITKEIEILGINKDQKLTYWDGVLNIVKTSSSDGITGG